MHVVHLTSSPFFGGPERQILGLSANLDSSIRTTVLCFRDRLTAVPFLEELAKVGVQGRLLAHGNPQHARILGDVVGELRRERADLLICHGYKADVVGWIAARVTGTPVISVSRGWTGHTRKVRLNESLDRFMLRLMDTVVCVSEGQAAKVRRAGVRPARLRVIRNSINATRFGGDGAEGRAALQALFPTPRASFVLGIGRLSPEKGFDVLLESARAVVQARPDAGFVLIGEGPERARLEQRVRELGLESHVAFAGFRSDVDRLMEGADLLAQSSHTEGMPNVVLEACAAGVAVVATDVGGTGEVIVDGVTGYLVPAGDAAPLAARLLELLADPAARSAMGARGRDRVRAEFSFDAQRRRYEELFAQVTGRAAASDVAPRREAAVGTVPAGPAVPPVGVTPG